MISAAVGRGGETMISAQTIEAFWNAVEHVKPLSVGLNCSLGPDLMYPFLEGVGGEVERGDLVLSECGACRIRCRRRGLIWGRRIWRGTWANLRKGGLINIAGGCCGNTPEHIAAIAKALEGKHPRELATQVRRGSLDGREPVSMPPLAKSAKDDALDADAHPSDRCLAS